MKRRKLKRNHPRHSRKVYTMQLPIYDEAFAAPIEIVIQVVERDKETSPEWRPEPNLCTIQLSNDGNKVYDFRVLMRRQHL